MDLFLFLETLVSTARPPAFPCLLLPDGRSESSSDSQSIAGCFLVWFAFVLFFFLGRSFSSGRSESESESSDSEFDSESDSADASV